MAIQHEITGERTTGHDHARGDGPAHARGPEQGHGHGHDHVPRGPGNEKRLAVVLVLVLFYMVAEVIGGLLTNSLALLADAGHMLSDAAALGLALFAVWFARRPAPSQHTFGYYRTEILAALANGATLIAIALFIFVEALQRFREPPQVEAGLMMAVAAGGLVVNLVGMWILRSGREGSLNVRGAWLHLVTDMLGSLQAIVAGGLILWLGWTWADPAASVAIALLVIFSAWGLLKESVSVLMQRAPGHLDVDELRSAILGMEGVTGICDLHVWTVTSGMESMSAHVVVQDGSGGPDMLQRVRDLAHDRFGIGHVTIQLEPEAFEEPPSFF